MHEQKVKNKAVIETTDPVTDGLINKPKSNI